jgi:Ca-activated chloride channel family protein
MRNGRRQRWIPYAAVAGFAVVGLGLVAHRVGGRNVVLTADQRGAILASWGRETEAATAFRNPLRRGAAYYRAGDFKAAAQAFAAADTPRSNYDQGTALVMLGKYDDAVGRFDRALALRPGWADAIANRQIAAIRAQRLKAEGGNDTDEKADDIVFDKAKKGGEDTTVAGQPKPLSDEAVRALWLKRVQTRPADFLRLRFAYQRQAQETPAQGRSSGAAP